MSKWGRKKKTPPPGFDYLEPTLTALEEELRERMNDPPEGKPRNEVLWPIHQINWQKSRYVYDMYYIHKRISREVYDYCVSQKLVDAALIAKWKKPGYERLCSTYVINTKNYTHGTVSICRVPKYALKEGTIVQDHTTGCRGCAPGIGGYSNIFGNKYGQRLAKIQIQREEREARVTKQIDDESANDTTAKDDTKEGELQTNSTETEKNGVECVENNITATDGTQKKRKRGEKHSEEDLWANPDEEKEINAEEENETEKDAAELNLEEKRALLEFQKRQQQS